MSAGSYTATIDRAPEWAPSLYRKFAGWLAEREYGSVGYFEFEACPVTPRTDWQAPVRKKVSANSFCFMRLPEGSELILIHVDADAPTPIVLLGSEGQLDCLADSLEAFLLAWAAGETDIDELDDEEAANGRALFGKWLKSHHITAPAAARFDFESWSSGATAPAGQAGTDLFAGDQAALKALGLDAELTPLVSLVGRRADDPVLIEFITDKAGKKCPATLRDDKWVTSSKLKVDFLFDPESKGPQYPAAKKGASFVPYLTTLLLGTRWKLPFGAKAGLSDDDLAAKFGPASIHKTPGGELKRWHVPLIPQRQVVLTYYSGGPIYIRLKDEGESFARLPDESLRR